MKSIFRVASLTGCILLAVSLATTAQADRLDDFWTTVRSGDDGVLGNEDDIAVDSTIRVVFVTSGTIDGDGDQRSYYDTFGDDSAESGLITGGLGLGADSWKPLVSTTNDIDKSGTNWDLGNPVEQWLKDFDNDDPVFNTAGRRVADIGGDMLRDRDGNGLPTGSEVSLTNAIQYDESGDDQARGSGTVKAWTGTDSTGQAAVYDLDGLVDGTLGSENESGTGFDDDPVAAAGSIADEDSDWLQSNLLFRQETDAETPETFDKNLPIYVMSGEVTVVPEPSTVLLWLGCSGLAGLIYWRKRRRG